MSSNIKKLARFFFNSKCRFGYLNKLGLYKYWDDERFLEKSFKVNIGKELNLDSPQSFNEKLQWLKLYDRKPIYTTMVDKYAVKAYVAELIGEEYIIPTLGVWDAFDDIDFDTLPEKFVLKCTHDSGGLIICKDKSGLNTNKAKRKLTKCLRHNYYYQHREWPYKDVKPRIIAEAYMEDSATKELRDYKFFCFDGEVKALFIATDRNKVGEEVKFDFFDAEFNHLDMRQGHDNANELPEKPLMFEKMKELASKLSREIPHVRVDFYEVDGQVYFGEMTFYHFGGLVPFEPEEWDYKLGDLINLPKHNA